ncbi:twin transmembrane helix small protein [Alkalilimnicola ehrlichii MLHE-1]|uniref:DUF2909 domain-containing protein n=1 Tax=Alkalilimnicola ehrlichii (strain ATCC BAA-1101 / DSM 17681 / MLHE-1) TaxID=187272 RepID=Q0ABY5_ALKEH|nr:twin transmembrane helix small protein [Alkalilimnicola ehrlichii]ABI55652.1 hypothetical protein Mlg_0297 [Alkalilimnicola ehrlichii MLHE-1]
MATVIFKGLVVLALLAIIWNLGAAAVALSRDGSDQRRVVRALTWRIGLSVVVFVLVLVAIASGLVVPNPSPLHVG